MGKIVRSLANFEIPGSLCTNCGKVTTPVHVVDKATNRQTLFDRIALADTRFEVIKRDRELEALRAQLALRGATSKTPPLSGYPGRRARADIDAWDADREFSARPIVEPST